MDGAAGKAAATVDDSFAGDVDERHGFGLTRFESNGGSGGDVETFAVGFRPVKFERGIRLM